MAVSASFRAGLRNGLVLLVPIGAFGGLFGVLIVRAGFTPWLAVLSSLVILSGSAQLAMVGLLPSGVGAVLVATTGLALRHIPMSASIATMIGRQRLWRRLALAWILVDESFGLTVQAVGAGESNPASYKAGVDVVLYFSWVVSTALGAYFGTSFDPARFGLDVIFPLLFLALAAPLVHTKVEWITALSAVASGLVALLVLPGPWRVTSAALAAALIGSRFRE